MTEESFDPMLWIDMRLQIEEKSSRFFTTGMRAFGKFEIEIDQTSMDSGELFQYMGDLIIYILKGNVTIKDGETIGRTAEEKFKVRYAKSLFDRGTVMKIEIP